MPRTIGRKVIRYATVTSTNDLARRRAEDGEAEGLVICAEEQTAGRGRFGRSWVAPPHASLQLSVLLRPPLPPVAAPSIMQMTALATAAALRETIQSAGTTFPPQIDLKWPNDVLLNNRKCAGILVETAVEDETLAFVVLGIGINVNHSMRDFPQLAGFATTIADELGHTVDRDALQAGLLTRLDEYYGELLAGKQGREAIFEEWRARLVMLGNPVRINTPNGIEDGIAVDVEADGALLFRRRDELVRFYSGDVTLLKWPEGGRLS